MTIEEKARAYDEAIERANAAYKDEDRHLKATLERIFPELRESEDEKIRNQIINFIEEYGNPIHCEWQKDWIAWLEKQGEHVEINPTEFDTRLQALIGKFETLPKDELVGSLSFWLNVVQNDGTYKADEKQDKQNPCETCSSPRLNCQNFPCEKKKNFDFSNKVEPKFKVDDFIVNDYGMVMRITGIKNDKYEFIFEDKLQSWPIVSTDRNCHLWTIKDAKDGDVIASDLCDSIILFKGINDDNNIDYYCDYDFSEFDVPGDRFSVNNGQHYGNVEVSEDFHPATKEQRDILMKAMADAGYAFDFKKLELKKIVVPIFNIGDTIVEKDLDEFGYGTINNIKDGQYIFTDGSGINIDEQEGWQLKTSTSIERKPADWSDEDEKMLNQIVSIIEDADLVRPENISIYTNWLKSLKPKYQWKPTIRQLTALEYAVNDNTLSCDELYTLNELYEQLKKL